ncbi:LGFP repeat-containing protein [Geodermatophilus obscurus]|uniref:LGFP repeat-containing protein n=1 Tax=Geodermatophilus obscurus TaxID=1861 RepID=A0A1M7UQ42_9ACTN|nr:hypothetical protein [Geodermatophilus obscurus]SHN85153.1 LGFP repeat-containing protein [Geodermatophilus obscurus]
MRSRLRLITTALVGLGLAFAFVAGSSPQPADLHESADLRLFDPGSIISDDLFFNGAAMNGSEVQAFLDAKGVKCQPAADGSPCLKHYRQTTGDRPADQYCRGYAGRPDESAADIITKAGAACGISQRVLLVMLQKEQSLVTGSGSVKRYREAMGYACPDNGGCDPAYNGFANQVYSAARRYQVYAKNPTSYAHRPGMTVQIRYFPEGTTPEKFNYQSRDCGKVPVYIRNQATAGLYNYTPYVPNQAALSAGYGTGDRCSTYGNRNFFHYYVDWFGNTQSGPSSVTEKHALLKASGVDLGAPTTGVICDLPNGGCRGSWQHGTIFWSQYTGAHVVRGAILQHFLALGGVPFLGYPTGDDTAAPVNPGWFTDFQGGAIYWSQATGAREVRGNLLDTWRAKGAQAGVLGYPVGGDEAVPGGFRSRFQGGTLYWSAPTGARMLRGAILARYEAAGGPRAIGFPTTDDVGAAGGGAKAELQGGAIYWSSATGARVVRGAILARWRAWGAESGALGYPTGDDQAYASGFRTTFRGGHVYWSGSTGAHVMRGALLDRYLAHGGAPVLGFPTTDDVGAAGGGAKAELQGGAIYWSPATGAHVVRGAILARWREWGAEAGALGYPTGDDAAGPNGGYLTTFRGGTVWWSPGAGAKVLRGAILDRYVAHGGPRVLGYPTTDDVGAAGGGAKAELQGGAIYWSPATGAHVVRGAILARWRAWGAESGVLGYPTGDDAVGPNGGYLTTFRGGTVWWSPAAGAKVMRGAILQRYLDGGGPQALGYPTTDDVGAAGGGAKAELQGGAIYWSPATGARVVRGEILAKWRQWGAESGVLGYPTGDDAAAPDGGYLTTFRGGTVFWSPATGAKVVRGALLERYVTAGGPQELGYPTTDDVGAAGGGAKVELQDGAIYWSPATGAHVVTGEAAVHYVEVGETTSPLGYPTADTVETSTGTLTEFEHGEIVVENRVASARVH